VMSQTHASPPAWLAIALNNRRRTGSAKALSLTVNSVADFAVSGSRSKGGTSQQASTTTDDFDIYRY
jgi:hypothetical protein